MKDPRYRTKRWRQARQYILTRDGLNCAIANCTTDLTQPHTIVVDHIIEVRDGGPFWDPRNHQILCKPHHNRKTADQATIRRTTRTSPNA